MATLSQLLWGCAITLSSIIYLSYIGDDDVVYKFMGRKPSQQEALKRIRFVLVKTFASIFSGFVLSILIGYDILKVKLGVTFTENRVLVMVFSSFLCAYILIGALQNQIRRFQGRQTHPIFDIEVWKYNLRQWKKY